MTNDFILGSHNDLVSIFTRDSRERERERILSLMALVVIFVVVVAFLVAQDYSFRCLTICKLPRMASSYQYTCRYYHQRK